MAQAGTVWIDVLPNTSKFGPDLARQVQGATGGTVSGLTRVQNAARSTFTQVGRLAQVGAIAVGAVGVAAVRAAIDFESAFAGVEKTVDGTAVQMDALRTGILDMSNELPASQREIAAVAEAAGQLGIQTDNVLEFSRVMLDLGETTNLSADQAATALARLANITQLPQDQFDELGSTIVALGNNLATTEAEIVEMALRISGAGAQIGLTEAEILGFAGALSSVGIEAQAGGTAISRTFIEIANAAATGGEELQGFADVAGTSVEDFQRAFEEDAAGAVVSFIEGLARISEEGGNVFAVLDELGLGEIRVRDALLRAAGAGDLFAESIGLASQAWAENTALTDEALKRYETLAAQIDILRNNAQGTLIALGDMLTPLVGPVIGEITSGLQGLQEQLQGLPEAFHADEVQAAIDTVKEGLEGLEPVVAGVGLALASKFASAIPFIGAVVPSIGLVTGALAGLVLSSDQGREALVDIGGTLVDVGRRLAPVFEDALRDLAPPLGEVAGAIAELAAEAAPALGDGLAAIVPVITTALVPALTVLAETISFVASVDGLAGPAVGGLLGFMVGGPWGAAIGVGVGLLGELAGALGAGGEAADEMRRYQEELEGAIRGVSAAILEQEGVISQVATIKALRQEFLDAGEEGDTAARILGDLGITFDDLRVAVSGGPQSISAFRRELHQLTDLSTYSDDEMSALWSTVGGLLDTYEIGAERAAQLAETQNDVAFFTNRAAEASSALLAALITGDLEQIIPAMDGVAEAAGAIARNTLEAGGSIEDATAASGPFIESLVASAEQMGYSEEQARNYVARLFEVPEDRRTEITNNAELITAIVDTLNLELDDTTRHRQGSVGVDIDPADREALRQMRDELNAITGTHTVYINQVGGLQLDTRINPPKRGGWTGGLVPGPEGQAVPMTLHGGEFVLSSDVADAIRTNRATRGLDALPDVSQHMLSNEQLQRSIEPRLTVQNFTLRIDGNINGDQHFRQQIRRAFEEEAQRADLVERVH